MFEYFVSDCAGLPVQDEGLPNNILTSLDYALFENKEAYVYDDNMNLVKLMWDDAEEVGDQLNDSEIPSRVFFYLYKKNDPNPKELYVDNEDVLKNSNFDPAKPTRFVTHGWINSRNSEACTLVRDGMYVNVYRIIQKYYIAFRNLRESY